MFLMDGFGDCVTQLNACELVGRYVALVREATLDDWTEHGLLEDVEQLPAVRHDLLDGQAPRTMLWATGTLLRFASDERGPFALLAEPADEHDGGLPALVRRRTASTRFYLDARTAVWMVDAA